jgi:stearoyl-CoA desaturase (delta-9 desaturase)
VKASLPKVTIQSYPDQQISPSESPSEEITRDPERAPLLAHEMPASFLKRAVMLIAVVGPVIALVIGCYLFWNRGISATDVTLMLSMYVLTILGVTLGFHRLFTHRSFQTYAPIRSLLAILGSMSVQGPVIKWCAVHRRHHQCSDHHGDPHSPHLHGTGVWSLIVGFYHSHVGWLFKADPSDLDRSTKDLRSDRAITWVNATFPVWVAVGILIPGLIGWWVSGSWIGLLSGMLWGGFVRILLMHHITWSINSICHTWGSRDFVSNDHSTNNLPIAIFSLGEGWHNNHHAFPTSARHGLRWWQIDFTWIVIWVMQKLRLVWDVRVPNLQAQRAKRVR